MPFAVPPHDRLWEQTEEDPAPARIELLRTVHLQLSVRMLGKKATLRTRAVVFTVSAAGDTPGPLECGRLLPLSLHAAGQAVCPTGPWRRTVGALSPSQGAAAMGWERKRQQAAALQRGRRVTGGPAFPPAGRRAASGLVHGWRGRTRRSVRATVASSSASMSASSSVRSSAVREARRARSSCMRPYWAALRYESGG